VSWTPQNSHETGTAKVPQQAPRHNACRRHRVSSDGVTVGSTVALGEVSGPNDGLVTPLDDCGGRCRAEARNHAHSRSGTSTVDGERNSSTCNSIIVAVLSASEQASSFTIRLYDWPRTGLGCVGAGRTHARTSVAVTFSSYTASFTWFLVQRNLSIRPVTFSTVLGNTMMTSLVF